MAIEVRCGCGKGYRVGDEKAGRKLKCRECGEILVIPGGQRTKKKPARKKPAPEEAAWDEDEDFGADWEGGDWDDEDWGEEEWDGPGSAPPTRAKSGGGTSTKKPKRTDPDDEEDEDPDDEDGPAWHNFVWGGLLTGAAIIAFFYLRWMKAQGEEFTGEGGRGLERFLAFAYSIGGEWAASGVLLALAGFFFWCGYTEMQQERERKERERRRKRKKGRR